MMICDKCQSKFTEAVPPSHNKTFPRCPNCGSIQLRQDVGGVKHDSGKPPITLLDRDFIEGTAQVMRFGAEKYGRHNWCGGMEHTRLADAAMRHIIAWASGEDLDPESGLPHIDHASASLNMLRGNLRLHPGMDDRYRRES